MKIISCANEIYKYKCNEKLVSDGVTFIVFVFTNNVLSIDEIENKVQSVIDEFHDQDFKKYLNNYCVSYQGKNGILVNYQLDEDYPNESEYKKFLNEIKTLSQIQCDFAESINNFKKLYLAYYSPTTMRAFEFSGKEWKQTAIKLGYA